MRTARSSFSRSVVLELFKRRNVLIRPVSFPFPDHQHLLVCDPSYSTRVLKPFPLLNLPQPSQTIMHSTLRFGYAVIEWRMFYLRHAGQNGVTTSCNNPRFSSSVRWSDTEQRFSVAISDCVTANGDRATFIALLVTTAPFLLQEPFLSDTPKSTRSFLGHDTLNWQFMIDVSESVLLPSSKLRFCFMSYVCVYCVGYWGTRWLRWLRHCATSRRSRIQFPMGSLRPHFGTEVDSASNRNEYQGYLIYCAVCTKYIFVHTVQ